MRIECNIGGHLLNTEDVTTATRRRSVPPVKNIVRSVRITWFIDLGVLIHYILRKRFVRTLVIPFETNCVLRCDPLRIQCEVFGWHDTKNIRIHQL